MRFQSALHLGQVAVPDAKDSKSEADAKKHLHRVVSQSHEPLCEARTVFPFDLFPDSIIVDRTKLTIINRVFFWVADYVTINLEDILNVTSTVGPFFGSLQIHTKFFDPGRPYKVNFLWRNDALRIERILQGYTIAVKEKVDMSKLDSKEMANMLDQLGKGMY